MVTAGGSQTWAGGWYPWNSPGEIPGGGIRGEVTVGGWVPESQMARRDSHPAGTSPCLCLECGLRDEEEEGRGWGKRQENSRYGDTASPEFSSGGSSRNSRRLQFRPQDLKAAGPALRRDSGAAMRPRRCHLVAAET